MMKAIKKIFKQNLSRQYEGVGGPADNLNINKRGRGGRGWWVQIKEGGGV